MRVYADAYTLKQLSQLLAIPVDALRVAVANGSLDCLQRELIDPVISRDAAIEFCVNVGIDTRRLAR